MLYCISIRQSRTIVKKEEHDLNEKRDRLKTQNDTILHLLFFDHKITMNKTGSAALSEHDKSVINIKTINDFNAR